MLSITQLESNIRKLKAEVLYQEKLRQRGLQNDMMILSLKTSLRAYELQLVNAMYEQAEQEADRIDRIREEMLCSYGL
jgi:hypothetical protein